MNSAEVFEAIAALPPTENAALVSRLCRETTLLEDWRDVAVFDARHEEETVSLDGHLQGLGLDVTRGDLC